MSKDGFRASVDRWGLWPSLLAWVYRRMNRLCGLHIYLINSRPLSQVQTGELPPGHQVRRLREQDDQAILDNPELGMDTEFLQHARTRGDVCIGYFVQDELVSYFWCGFSEVPAEPGL